jgi:hypothetical protein
MSEFNKLLDDMDNFVRRRGAAPSPPAVTSRPAASTWGDPAARRADRANFAKAIDDIQVVSQAAKQTAQHIQAQSQGLRLEDIKNRARALVAKTRQDLREAVTARKLTPEDAAKSEAFLNNFVVRMGI